MLVELRRNIKEVLIQISKEDYKHKEKHENCLLGVYRDIAVLRLKEARK